MTLPVCAPGANFFDRVDAAAVEGELPLSHAQYRMAGLFDYIEMLYNPQRTHTNDGMLSPVTFETRPRN